MASVGSLHRVAQSSRSLPRPGVFPEAGGPGKGPGDQGTRGPTQFCSSGVFFDPVHIPLDPSYCHFY